MKVTMAYSSSDMIFKITWNILKYYRFNWFKEFAIGFNNGIQTKLEFPVNFSGGLLVWIGKCYCYPCLRFINDVAWSFVDLTHPTNKKGNVIRTFRRLDIKDDVVIEIFSKSRLGSPIYMDCCSLFAATLSIQGNTNFYRHLMWASLLSLRLCGKIIGGITSLS